MSTNDLISKIHDSSAFGTIVEAGVGMPLFQQLWSLPGASGTIFQGMAPYAKEAQGANRGLIRSDRSVSYDTVRKSAEALYWYFDKLQGHGQNFYFVSSWQVGKDMCNHGWIAIVVDQYLYTFHVTFPVSASYDVQFARQYANGAAGFSSLCCLYYALFNELNPEGLFSLTMHDYPFAIDYATKQLVVNMDDSKEEILPDLLFHLSNTAPVCFNKDGYICRLEDIVRPRMQEEIPIFKGSFNPLHEGHLAIIEQEDDPIIWMNTRVYDKPDVTPDDMLRRVRQFKDVAPVVVHNLPLFYDTNRALFNRFGEDFKPLYVVGQDTYDRIGKTEQKYMKFSVHDRGEPYISSTQIRTEKCACGNGYDFCSKFTEHGSCEERGQFAYKTERRS